MFKIIYFLTFFITSSFVFSKTIHEEPIVLKKELPIITMAYSWGYGFNTQISEYKKIVSNEFLIDTQENLGLNHKQKILIDASSNSLPDIFTFWSYETNLKFLADNNLIINIDEYFKLSSKYSRDNFYLNSLAATEIDGVNYAIPHEKFFGFFAVNRSILNKFNLKIPETWDDLKNMSPILNKNGITPLSMGSFRGDPGHLFFSALAYQHPNGFRDTVLMKKNNIFINEGNRMAANAIGELIKFKVIPQNTIYEGSFDKQIDQYNNLKSAMIFAFSWSLARFNEDVAEDTVIIPIPRINENSLDTGLFTVGGAAQSICISKKAWEDPNKQEYLIKILDWLLTDDFFTKRMFQSGSYPAKKMDMPEIDSPIYIKAASYMYKVKHLGLHEFYFNSLFAFNQFKEANDLLWSGSITSEEFLTLVQNGMIIDDK